jgi:putative transposase
MRYPSSEKLEIIAIVEQSPPPAQCTVEQLGIPRRTLCRWYDRCLEGGPEALPDRTSAPSRVWIRIGENIQQQSIGWGEVYLSTMLDEFPRYVIAWKLCTTMRAGDVADMLELAFEASVCSPASVVHKPRLLSDNGPCYIAEELVQWISANGMSHIRDAPVPP